MIVNITGDNITLTDALKEFSNNHVTKLQQLNPNLTRAEVVIKKEHLDCIAEINLSLPKKEINAKATDENMYKAIEKATKKAASQLRKTKTKKMQRHKGEPISETL